MPANVEHFEGDYVLDIEPGQAPGPFSEVSRVSGNGYVPTLNGDFVLRTNGIERGRIKADGTATGVFVAGAADDDTTIAANTQTVSYTLVLADAGEVIELNSASAITLTVPPHSSVAFATGTVIEVYAMGAGVVTVAAGGGVTIRNIGNLAGQYKTARLRYRGSDEWVLSGELA